MTFADTELWRQLSERIGEHRRDRIEGLSGGFAGTPDKYWDAVGFLRALEVIERDVQEIGREMNQSSRNSQSDSTEKDIY